MAANLRDIRAFPELVRYLEDELDWPLQEYGFDELTFEFTPAELGLKEEDAASIKTIHQLRPLASGQPWGIFFVEFENKKLPVVVLRRILSHLVIKKRASANKASAPAWHAEDLLFVTAFGEDGIADREIAFAHFHQNPGDLPTLHVLGWDGGDTPLKLANVDRILHERLHWPEDESDTDAWRDAWRKPFKHKLGHTIRTADLLAEELARLARGIRDKARRMLAAESENGALTKLFKAFQTALIHDLTPDSFADTYAQTITYGLLTAAISRTEMSEGRHGTFVKADDIADIVPVTNPFLKEMLQTFLKAGGRKGGIDFDELGIQDVVELLRGEETDLPAVIADFGNKNPNEDPVIHFYEHFLAAYDKPQKKQRGVFYTPQPVVSYIVRSVHELLQTEFGLEDGLASTITWGEMVARKLPSPLAGEGQGERGEFTIPEGTSPDAPFVTILDPATGTATFLVEVISVIHRTLTEKWKKQDMPEAQRLAAWNDYVPAHLLPRLFGYELMMAPYAISHMKIGLKLFETGYRFGSEERVRIYLTNALEPAHEVQPQLEAMAPALAHEAQAVSEVKQMQRFTVVVGNPPYSVLSANLTDAARGIVDLYRYVDGIKIKERSMLRLEMHLQDDYVKFMAFSQRVLQQTDVGILGFITNNGFLDNLTLRGVRFALLQQFNQIFITDLHGNRLRQGTGVVADENVFDIEQGVAISIASSTGGKLVKYADIDGSREKKYITLQQNTVATTKAQVIKPQTSQFFLVPRDDSAWPEFKEFISLLDVMPVNISGIVTAHDNLVIDFGDQRLIENARALRNSLLSVEQVRVILSVKDNAGWKLAKARTAMQSVSNDQAFLHRYGYRPFDTRRIYYHPALVWSDRRKVMSHVLAGNNVALATCRQLAQTPWEHIFVTRELQDDCFVSNRTRERSYHFPLHLRGPEQQRGSQADLITEDGERGSNFSKSFIKVLAIDVKHASPESIFHYIYAILHSPTYRTRYSEFLKIDFPRIPVPGGLPLFQFLANLGGELVALHLLESPKVNDFITRFEGQGDNSIPKKPVYKDGAVWINASQRFEGVPEAVWNFHVGCYQVCEKWLKDRKGRTLSDGDIAHYQRVVVALNETIRLMAEIDRVIEAHGGWPGAFHSTVPKESA